MADVLLVDGNNLAHRCWHAGGGDVQRAADLFGGMLRRAVVDVWPTYRAVAFDSPDCWRRDHYPAYKAGRAEREPALTDWLERMASGRAGVPGVVRAERHEADDVLATLTNLATQRWLTVCVLTADRDAWALCAYEGVEVMTPGALRPMTAEDVKAKLGVWPGQVRDYKALAGDASDNIPGVPGIGPLRAAGLLRDHGTFGDALDHLRCPPVRGPLDEAKEAGKLAYRVVGLNHQAPVSSTLDDCRIGKVGGASEKAKG